MGQVSVSGTLTDVLCTPSVEPSQPRWVSVHLLCRRGLARPVRTGPAPLRLAFFFVLCSKATRSRPEVPFPRLQPLLQMLLARTDPGVCTGELGQVGEQSPCSVCLGVCPALGTSAKEGAFKRPLGDVLA